MNVVSILIILASLAALLTVVMAKPGQAPDFFGYSLFRVMTGSMEPTISTDSLIVVKRTDPRELSVGDVITFYSRDPSLLGEPNTHRIIRIEEDAGRMLIYTKGDANNIEDHYHTREEDVIGKVVFTSLKLGRFVKLISNPLIFIPLIVIPLAIMLVRSIFDSVTAAKTLAKAEEEAAVREALAQLREKRRAQAAEDGTEKLEEEPAEAKEEETVELEEEPAEVKEEETVELEEEPAEAKEEETVELEEEPAEAKEEEAVELEEEPAEAKEEETV